MDVESNAAGRLYVVLGELRAFRDEAISSAWEKILGVPVERIGSHIGTVAQLVPQLEQAVAGEGFERQAEIVQSYRDEWLNATFPLAQPFNQAVKSILPSDHGYLALGGMIGALPADGAVPTETTRDELSELLRATKDEVLADGDLPTDVALLILKRLAQIEMAITHLRLGGPLAVKEAADTLIGSVDTARATDERAWSAPSLRKVAATAGVIFSIFAAPAQMQPALQQWEHYAHELTPAQVHVAEPAQLQLESGPTGEQVLEAEVVAEEDGRAPTGSG